MAPCFALIAVESSFGLEHGDAPRGGGWRTGELLAAFIFEGFTVDQNALLVGNSGRAGERMIRSALASIGGSHRS